MAFIPSLPSTAVTWTPEASTVLSSLLIDYDGGYLIDILGTRILLGGDFVIEGDTPVTWTPES